MKYTKPIYVFVLIVCSFLVYSFSIYLDPFPHQLGSDSELEQAAEGKMVWQKYNCQSCHQIYGLGGYLGPDLTDTYSAEGKGEPFFKAMITVGAKQMPAFNMSEEEFNKLMCFMKFIDKTGNSDPRKFTIHKNGMISEHE